MLASFKLPLDHGVLGNEVLNLAIEGFLDCLELLQHLLHLNPVELAVNF